jgi:hypothetical protein
MVIFSVNLIKKKKNMKKWVRNIMKLQISERLMHQVKRFSHFILFGKISHLKNHLRMQTFMMFVQHLIGESKELLKWKTIKKGKERDKSSVTWYVNLLNSSKIRIQDTKNIY